MKPRKKMGRPPSEVPPDSIGGRIRSARIAAGYTTAVDLAATMGVTWGVVSMWETGRARPSTDNLARLAGLLGVTMDWLLRGDAAGGGGPHGQT